MQQSIRATLAMELIFYYFNAILFADVPFPFEPVFHGVFEFIDGDTGSALQNAVGDRKRVIEDSIIGEAAHGEVVQPFQGTGCAIVRD